ncbi:hypothetical protein GOBAR_DD36745 [Gossypium barbadense]|nr:hypothetical protein GOBAR_DD36745 [Gossypium barbadense]
MAETDSYTKHYQLLKQQNQTNPNKYNTSFLYKKAVVIIIFLVIIPVFPSQAPEFINQTLLKHSWELLRLLFFGIAVSYGLFSQRNDETDKEPNNQSMFDNVQCFVSRFLQASSFFDDEAENMSGSDESKVQIWSSQYYRNELPTVLVAKKKGDDEIEKPLLLPVRSLKSSRVMEVHNGENNVVLPSLIPWRSRDGDIVKNKASYSTNNGENNAEAVGPNNGIDGGSDVDKKADEFIAKVREQIRLQMIDSIKRWSGQIKRNSTSVEGRLSDPVLYLQ